MSQVTIEDAAGRLAQLIDEANSGAEVIIIRDNQPIAKLVGTAPSSLRTPRKFGLARGKGYMTADFEAPLDDFREYME